MIIASSWRMTLATRLSATPRPFPPHYNMIDLVIEQVHLRHPARDEIDQLAQGPFNIAGIATHHGDGQDAPAMLVLGAPTSAIDTLCRWAMRSLRLFTTRRLSFKDIASVTESSSCSTPTVMCRRYSVRWNVSRT